MSLLLPSTCGYQVLRMQPPPSLLTAMSARSSLRHVHSRLYKTKNPGIIRYRCLASQNIFPTITIESDVGHINSRKNQTFAFLYSLSNAEKQLKPAHSSTSLFSFAFLMAGGKCMYIWYILLSNHSLASSFSFPTLEL